MQRGQNIRPSLSAARRGKLHRLRIPLFIALLTTGIATAPLPRAAGQVPAPAPQPVATSDADIDALHTSVFQDLLSDMLMESEHVIACTHLMFAIKNLERIGDHATNVAELIYYQATGKELSDRPKAS